MRHRQRGITFIGLLFLIALVGLPVYAVIRLVPVYLNYMSVSRSMESLKTEFRGAPDPSGIRRSLEKHFQIDDTTGIEAKEIEITKDGSGVTVHAAYDDKVPYIGNVSLVVSFDKTVTIE
ncbi:MAG: DUF4845 domain-containing protein [Steroidobacterales bacterium]